MVATQDNVEAFSLCPLPLMGTCCDHGGQELKVFCFSASGRVSVQLMGQCRGRTHIPMALCVAPAPWRFAATMKTGNVYRQAAGPRNGRLAIECDVQRAVGPFWAGRRFQHSTPNTWGREPRGYLCLRWCGGSDSGGKVLLNAPRERLRQWQVISIPYKFRHGLSPAAAIMAR